MTPTTAIQRAEQWRKENACGEAAKVAIALLNELQALQASRAIPEGHVVVPKEPTKDMVWKAEEDTSHFRHGDPWYGTEPISESQVKEVWAAMIAAAPANKEET